MSSLFGNGASKRKRVSGVLTHGGRGLNILTDAGDLWVIDQYEVDPDLLGRRVTAEGTLTGLDRLNIEWMGESLA